MRLLLVSATVAEITPLLREMHFVRDINPRLRAYTIADHEVEVLISGVGMTATAALVSKTLAEGKYAAALNVGICGTFDRTIALGETVQVSSDCISELGAEDGDKFLSVHDLQLVGRDDLPLTNGKLLPVNPGFFGSLSQLRACDGISVNRVHGSVESIEKVVARLNPGVESMEGAGFYFACSLFAVPSLQVRSISNYVERRNRGNWKIKEAIENLNTTIQHYLLNG